MTFAEYDPEEFFDEMFARAGAPRAAAHALTQVIDALPAGEIEHRQRSAERALLAMGITFNVYGADEGTERIFPFDLIPRIVSAAEWRTIERGLKQRIHALNLFIDDIYQQRRILKDRVIPDSVLETAASLRAPCAGLHPPRGIWCHVTGTDLVRHSDGQVYVLEDNRRQLLRSAGTAIRFHAGGRRVGGSRTCRPCHHGQRARLGAGRSAGHRRVSARSVPSRSR
jgi:uncharacterized circularly permuted ATP-grasp superfamily protein